MGPVAPDFASVVVAALQGSPIYFALSGRVTDWMADVSVVELTWTVGYSRRGCCSSDC